MSLPIWGLLQRALGDPQTIDEAIAAAVAAHEEDPTAHLGVGESLEQHKTDGIVDHPAGSVLPDKISFSDYQFDTTFESLGGFTITGRVTNNSWPGASFDIFDGGGDDAMLRANMVGVIPSGAVNYDILVDIYFNVDSVAYDWDMFAGISNTNQSIRSLGFEIVNGNIIGTARWGWAKRVTPTLFTITGPQMVFARVRYDHTLGVIYYYINGEQVGTLTPVTILQVSNQWSVKINANTEEGAIIRLHRLTFARSLPII